MLFISIAKALVEVAAMCLVAQWVVGFFAQSQRHSNPIYRLFSTITQPVNILIRKLMPQFVIDEHIPLASLLSLVAVWLLLIVAKVQLHAAL
jgi:uncharacterized protein YggT (Ycf19 family)